MAKRNYEAEYRSVLIQLELVTARGLEAIGTASKSGGETPNEPLSDTWSHNLDRLTELLEQIVKDARAGK